MVVGDDVAATVDDDAGALRALLVADRFDGDHRVGDRRGDLGEASLGLLGLPSVDNVTLDVVNASTTSAVLRPTQPPAKPISSAMIASIASAT